MTTRIIIATFLIALSISCTPSFERQEAEKKIKNNIMGSWIESNNFPKIPRYWVSGMTILEDSIDFYLGFNKESEDNNIEQKRYFGNVVPYKINEDSIFIKNPLTEKWEFRWTFSKRENDTLELADGRGLSKYKKLHYNLDTLPDFDQIIHSSSGCFGSCPIIDIAVDKEGNVLTQGKGYVKPLGFYAGHIDAKTKNYIFEKFRKSNPLQLNDRYSFSHSDDQTFTTTFIKERKIVKTIYDYGMAGTQDLIWAYIATLNTYSIIQLDSLPLEKVLYPELNCCFSLKRNGLILPLEKSEIFYLWTELKKSNQTDKTFKPEIKHSFFCNKNKTNQNECEIKSFSTDWRYYKFEFKNKKSITLDLGYNFIEQNFKPTDFKKQEE
jgi:hypothetical protein